MARSKSKDRKDSIDTPRIEEPRGRKNKWAWAGTREKPFPRETIPRHGPNIMDISNTPTYFLGSERNGHIKRVDGKCSRDRH